MKLVMVRDQVLFFQAVVVDDVVVEAAAVVAVVLTFARVQLQSPILLKRLVRSSDILLFTVCTSKFKKKISTEVFRD
jgi:hypothetical protein